MAVGEAAAEANLALAQAWLEARNDGDEDRTQSLTAADVRFQRTGERVIRGTKAVKEALAQPGESPTVLAIVPDGPFATATMSGPRGFETWRLRVADGFVSEIVVDPDPFA